MAKAAAEYGSLPFKEQIEFFRAKLNLPTAHWTDIYTKEHDWAFVVAGATRDALLCDLRAAVEKAINQGTTLEEFRRDFDSIVDKHGWHGWTGEDRKGGKAWRTRTIYETNIATSYAAGRYQQLQHAPLWRYVHADWVTTPRPQHQAWDGLILPKDDPWWNTHFPPNGWGCKCSVQGIWPDELGDFGKDAPDAAPGSWTARNAQRATPGPQACATRHASRVTRNARRHARRNRKQTGSAPEKVLNHSAICAVFWRQKQHFFSRRLVTFLYAEWLRMLHRAAGEQQHRVLKAVLSAFYEEINGVLAADSPRPPEPLTVGHFQTVMLISAVNAGRQTLELPRLEHLKVSREVNFPRLFN